MDQHIYIYIYIYIYNSDDEIKHLQLSNGSKIFPEYSSSSHAECFYKLKSLGAQANNLHAIDIKGHAYRKHKFVVGFDTEKMLGLAFTEVNNKNSLMTIKLKTDDGLHQAHQNAYFIGCSTGS